MGENPKEIGGFTSAYTWTKTDPAWIPELDDRLIARFEKLKSELKVEKRAYDDAAANSPKTTDTDLNATQMQIRDHAVQKVAMLFAFLSQQLGVALQNMASASDKLSFADDARKASTDFDNALSEDSALKSASDNLVKAEIGLRHFAATHHRTAPAHYRSSPLLFWAVIIGFLVLESVLNGFILQSISAGGFAGGVILALGISAVNVGTGVIGGAVGWRLLGHRYWFPKIIGIIVTIVTLFGAVFWNFLVAHYRQLAEAAMETGATDPAIFDPFATAAEPTDAVAPAVATESNLFGDALVQMNEQGWFSLHSMMAWLLLAVGLIVFLLACREGWDDMADRYWDYRKHDLKKVRADEEFERRCDQAIASASLKLDQSVSNCKAKVAAVEAKCAKSVALADLAEQRTVEVLNSEAHWIAEGNRLLAYYRECNDKVRHETNPAPRYWVQYPAPDDYRRFLAQEEGGEGSRNVELANSQLAEIRARRDLLEDIVSSNRNALALLEDEVRKLKASVPDRGKQLRKEAKDRAKKDVEAFLHPRDVEGSRNAGDARAASAQA
jgi:hypothetical protein